MAAAAVAAFMVAPSEQQHDAANQIFNHFVIDRRRYVLLKAYCQSGKTGAFQTVARMMLQDGSVERVYLLCGSNETELRSQAHSDTAHYNPNYYEEDNTGQFQVVFRQDFSKTRLTLNKTLIIVDESHMDATMDQELHQFLRAHRLSLNGDITTLAATDSYIISVDATPYAELASIYHNETPHARNKVVVTLQPGAGYFGLTEYLANGRIQPTFDISAAPHRFRALLEAHNNKYCLMRFQTGADAEATVLRVAAEVGVRVLYFTQDKTEVQITRQEGVTLPCLEDAPSVTTVVIVRQRLRAGKVVPKQHIGFVWEGAAQPNTDSVIQGLVGRMCGYVTAGAGQQMLFVSPCVLDTHDDKVVEESEAWRAVYAGREGGLMLPRKATNVAKGRLHNAAPEGKTMCPPVRVERAAAMEWVARVYTPDCQRGAAYQRHRNRLFNMKEQIEEAVRQSEHMTEAQKVEILGELFNAVQDRFNIRNIHADSHQKDWYKEILECYRSGTHPTEHVSDAPFMTAFLNYEGSGIPTANPNHIYFIFYTRAEGPLRAKPLSDRVPCTNGRSVFTVADDAFEEAVVATTAVGVTEAALVSPAAFKATLRRLIQDWLAPGEGLERANELYSDSGALKFDKRAFHYTAAGNDLQRLCAELEAELRVRISLESARETTLDFLVRRITWRRIIAVRRIH